MLNSSQRPKSPIPRAGLSRLSHRIFERDVLHYLSSAQERPDNPEAPEAEEEARERAADVDLLSRVAASLASTDLLEGNLREACREVADHFAAEYCGVILVDDGPYKDGLLVRHEARSGASTKTLTADYLQRLSLVSTALDTGEYQSVTDVETLTLTPSERWFFLEEGVSCLVAVPLIAVGALNDRPPVGALLIGWKETTDAAVQFGMQLLQAIAAEMAAAIWNARLAIASREQAVLAERTRIGRDLHDAVTQAIYSATLVAEALPEIWQRDHEEGMRYLSQLRLLIRGALAEMRDLLFELRPEAIEYADLQILLQQLSDTFTARTLVPVVLDVHGDGDVPGNVKWVFFRVGQEALNNIGKHSKASRVWATLWYSRGAVCMEVRDDGVGFDPDTLPSEGMGLHIMRERAEGIGATLRVAAGRRGGTRLLLTWSPDGEDAQ